MILTMPTQCKLTAKLELEGRSAPGKLRCQMNAELLLKFLSDEIDLTADKENTPQAELPNPKKRTKTTATGGASNRAMSRSKVQPSQVLSPKSSNSRTLPQSPIRPVASPSRAGFVRPASPLKPSIPVTEATVALSGMLEKTRTTRAVSVKKTTLAQTASAGSTARAGRTASKRVVEKRIVSNSSEASTATTGTVVTKAKPGRKTAVKAKAVAVSGTGKKVVPAKEEPSTTAPRRVLRKRA